jgi:hypothetical protein
MAFARFMSSTAGRLLRVAAGIALVYLGWVVMGGVGGVVVAVVGLAPLMGGAFNFCIFAPLFGGPFLGKDVHEKG